MFCEFVNHLRSACVISDLVVKYIGEEAKYEGIRLLFDGLQQPLLNKQVHKHTRRNC